MNEEPKLYATAYLANRDEDKKFDIEGGDRLTSRVFRCVIRNPNTTISGEMPRREAMSNDMQAHYQNLGYRVASDGAVEFYYLTLATKVGSMIPSICVNGLFSWSNHNHDPAVTIRSLPKKQGEYALNRIGPFPHRSDCETKAMDLAHQYHHNPSAYGIFGTGGLHEIADADYRDPRFR